MLLPVMVRMGSGSFLQTVVLPLMSASGSGTILIIECCDRDRTQVAGDVPVTEVSAISNVPGELVGMEMEADGLLPEVDMV